ncbi:MAG TPA: NUDIX hydrolase [Planctomycetota bacterium]|nr:NUDIX hydrolase [Planctomycetota bacterium]
MGLRTRTERFPSQAAAVPFRVRGRVLEVALITSARSGRWGIPKGNIERGEGARASARREALEEAGLEGDLVGPRLGSFRYEKRGRRLSVAVYLLRVTRELPSWSEEDLRQRKWLRLDKALERLHSRELARLLGDLAERIPA